MPGARACFLSSARRFLCARFLVGPGIVDRNGAGTMSEADDVKGSFIVPVRCEMTASNEGLQSREENYNRPLVFWAGGVRSWAPGGALQGSVVRFERGALWAQKIDFESTGTVKVRRVLNALCVVHLF